MFKRTVFSATSIGLMILSGCQTEKTYEQKRAEKACDQYYHISTKTLDAGDSLTVAQCIENALENNLDIKVQEVREAVGNARRTAAVLAMLPEVNINETMMARSNEPGSSSQNVYTGAQSLTPSKSSEKTQNTFNIDMALSVIDFGLAYFNSVQARDRELILGEQKKRAIQNLSYDVAKQYFRVAAVQYAIRQSANMMARTGNIEQILEDIQKEKNISALRALDEKRRFINLEKKLRQYQVSYEDSCIQLKAVMGFRPNHRIRVDDTLLDRLNAIKVPRVELLEKLAIRERPELYEADIQRHISIVDARKAILQMFPNVRMFADYNDASNKYLYNNQWWALGIRTAYDLFSVPKTVFEYRSKVKEAEALDAKTISLALGVMTQVRLAHSAMMQAKRVYDLENKAYLVYKEQLDAVRKIYDAGGEFSQLELDGLEMETADHCISKAFALSEYYLAYYRLCNAVGVSCLDPRVLEQKIAAIRNQEHGMAVASGK
ncbi:MAG: TolC family protein [Victivallales bacterium]|nr:TolC family protein [Victivallales bacterium]